MLGVLSATLRRGAAESIVTSRISLALLTTSQPALELAGLGRPTPLAPTEIRLQKALKRLEIQFNDGSRFSFPAEYLRAKSPSADTELDPHGRPKVISGRRHVGIMKVEPVGTYAVRILFDDLHQAGIYTWDYLHDLGTHKLSYAKQYLRKLRTMGLSRDPKARKKASSG